ncbi:MAG: glycosyltransferase family 39 protein [Bacteroidia bacterium]|nr:glycosyltransferase family 39 protein [Bacteroidia bacterium]
MIAPKWDSRVLEIKWLRLSSLIFKSDLFYLLIACGVIRLVYYYGLSDTMHLPDSSTYLNYNANIFLGYIDSFRTPVYPYFIKVIKLFGNEGAVHHIILAQMLISFLTIILFYDLAGHVFKTRAAKLLASFIYGILPSLIGFDKCILTESLSISAGTVFLWLVSRYLEKPSVLKAIVCTFYILFAVMLRPAYLILLPIMIVFWILRIVLIKSDLKMCLSGLAVSLICILFITAYTYLNYRRNGCSHISVVYHVNQLDNIINSGLYMDGNDPEISRTISNNMGKATPPWNDKIRNVLFAKYSKDRLAKFISGCIVNQPVAYMKLTANKISRLSKETTAVSYVNVKEGKISTFFLKTNKILAIPFLALYILLVFDFIVIVVQWARSRQLPWLKGFIWLCITFYFFTIITGAQAEYPRLFVVALPFVLILMFSYIDLIFNSIIRIRPGYNMSP